MIATTTSAVLCGLDGLAVRVEAHVGNGLPAFTVVGQPDAVCRESRDRIRAAFACSGLVFPPTRVTVNLAPSDTRKVGAGLDLAIAVALLGATEQVPLAALEDVSFLGELALDGTVQPVRGAVPRADACPRGRLVVPLEQVDEAALLGGHEVRGAVDLRGVVAALRAEEPWPSPLRRPAPRPPATPEPDLADVKGQVLARAAIEVAAAGAHHLLLTGPPGAGKTMLAERLPGLLPDLTPAQALEVARVRSAAGTLDAADGLPVRPPYVAPHHGASAVSLIGGGTASLAPGAVSQADHGVLFLDELAEFPPVVLDALRQPLESGEVRVHRAVGSAVFPARFLLVAAMNPCACGDGLVPGACRCTPAQRLRAVQRVSVPVLDRFDLRIVVQPTDPGAMLGAGGGEPSAPVAGRVAAARERAAGRGVAANARLAAARLEEEAPLSPGAARLLEHHLRRGRLTARGMDRARRVALTVADLQGEDPPLREEHLHLALGLRHDVLPARQAG